MKSHFKTKFKRFFNSLIERKQNLSREAKIRIFQVLVIIGISLFLQNSLYIPKYLEPMTDSIDQTALKIDHTSVSPIETEEANYEQIESPEQPLKVTVKSTFKVPENLRRKVDFWKQIYGVYSSEYGIIHDSKEVDLIYAIVDFTPITRSKLHPFTKEHRVNALIKREKEKVITFLKNLKKGNKKVNPKLLSANDKRIYDYFKTLKSKHKYDDAIENMRFQLGQKDFIEKAFYYSGFYLEEMEKIFLSANLPIELTRIPFVESSFNIMARSRVGASGIWQIMPSTGKKLMPNRFVDYRNDPIKATEFAATFLKFNHKVLKNWPLAITAYNHGPTSMLKISRKYQTNDLSELIRKAFGTKAFGFASTNFYTCFLAILEVEKNQKEYFPNLSKGSPKMITKVNLKKPMTFKNLVKVFDFDVKKLESYNPHLTTVAKNSNIPIPKGTILYFPSSANSPEMASAALEAKSPL